MIFPALTSGSVGGVEGRFSWSFRRVNLTGARRSKKLRGAGIRCFEYTGINVRNHGVSGTDKFDFSAHPVLDVSDEKNKFQDDGEEGEPSAS